jgi:hypothetical protein
MARPCDDNEHNFVLPLVTRKVWDKESQNHIVSIPIVLCSKCGQALRTDGPVNETLARMSQEKESEAAHA